ncbi:LysR family transcriptional regulator [Conexibacter woesei]|uniref:Transcriptional regulator, LysR family n=1 Tax=Conexibacter woesei (strain DSM 14684 / CCUG 47730 / CIP 108061 / JCM 11494 / NBRC 100937 / ID131577) TaxID=469383 RepID=D3FCT1_CONWI|nr:LysR family transcriptional regulator [Conexibacter woesei]ADB51443.1 transcriptional regulator, LysR family [Conexibacter woesei DSM 14684]
MTLAQLQSFVLVARLGSVRAAAAELEVTDPAISVAVGALRREFGDELFVRSGRGIALTPGGRRLAALASEILGLAEQARRSVRDTPDQPRRIEVAATGVVAEHVGPLLDAFGARDDDLEIAVDAVPGAGFADLLEHRRADIALGPHPGLERAATIATVPFLRCRCVVVATPGHPLARRRGIAPSALAAERWLVGPPPVDPTTGVGLFFERHGLAPREIGVYTSHAAAIAAAGAGDGIALTLHHSVRVELRRRTLVPLDVRGTPLVELWHASTLGLDRAPPAALALQRFATTPEAMHAMSAGRAGTTSARARPPVHVTLWSSVAP